MPTPTPFSETPAGRQLDAHLAQPATLGAMERRIANGEPAVAAIDPWAAENMPGLTDPERQAVGRMIRAKLTPLGYRVGPQRRVKGARVFTSGATYQRRKPEPEGPAPTPSQRLAKAIAILEAARDPSLPRDTVDAFLAERAAMWGES